LDGPNLHSLLLAQNLNLETNLTLPREDIGRVESVLWEDPFGPLKIYRISSGESPFYRLKLGEDVVVDVISDRRIAVWADPGAPQLTIDHFLADQVFPRVLSHHDKLVLHAGAIRVADSAILLLGPSSSGKSTLASSFDQAGWTLMGDDAVILASDNGRPTAEAVYPSLRLFPDSIEALFPKGVRTVPMAHYSSKQRIGVQTREHTPEPLRPLNAIFILGDAHGDRIAVRRLAASKACMALVENSFALDPSDPHQASRRMEGASRIVKQVPTFVISYPREYSRLPEVREAILANLDDGSPTGT